MTTLTSRSGIWPNRGRSRQGVPEGEFLPFLRYWQASLVDLRQKPFCLVPRFALIEKSLLHNPSFCDLMIRDAMLSRFAPLFQFQVPSSTVLWFYLKKLAVQTQNQH
jgi:hypothetical protein